MKAFVVMGRVLKAAYEDLFLCVFMSIAWWIGVVPVVTIPLVIMGMQNVGNRIANYKRVDNGFFWEGARTQIGTHRAAVHSHSHTDTITPRARTHRHIFIHTRARTH